MALAETGRREPATPWANMEVEDVLARLEVDRHHGLAPEEAARRLARYGPNRLPPPARHPVWLRFLLQFHNVLIYMMLVAAGIAALLSHWVDAAVLFAAVIVNAVMELSRKARLKRPSTRSAICFRCTQLFSAMPNDLKRQPKLLCRGTSWFSRPAIKCLPIYASSRAKACA